MGRKWTEEEKKAWSDKMKALATEKRKKREAIINEARKKNGLPPIELKPVAKPAPKVEATSKEDDDSNVFNPEIEVTEDSNPPVKEPVVEPTTTNISEQDSNIILARAIEAMTNLLANQSNNQGSQVAGGKLVGTTTKYSLDKTLYPDPSERLSNEKALERFGFKSNFELRYDISSVRYQTIDGIWQQEPKFILDLVRVMFDEETGEDTGGRYVEYRAVFHEDPESAMVVARDNGVNVDDFAEADFLNEMRYLQFRDWLFECFVPKKPKSQNNRKEMVINGKLVEYFEVNSEDSAKLPFNQLGNKL